MIEINQEGHLPCLSLSHQRIDDWRKHLFHLNTSLWSRETFPLELYCSLGFFWEYLFGKLQKSKNLLDRKLDQSILQISSILLRYVKLLLWFRVLSSEQFFTLSKEFLLFLELTLSLPYKSFRFSLLCVDIERDFFSTKNIKQGHLHHLPILHYFPLWRSLFLFQFSQALSLKNWKYCHLKLLKAILDVLSFPQKHQH